ncbi:MAG: DUF4336 domain-containing protein, partial [Cyanobacteria bacterium P01_F01_bin.153]
MELTEIAPDLWVATQPLRFLGVEVGSRMTVVRLPDGGLVLISPIALKDSDRTIIESLGTVRHIIAPNLFHHLSVGTAKDLCPDAKVWGVEGLQEKRPDVAFDNLLNTAGDFGKALEYLPFQGFAAPLPGGIMPVNETVFCHRPSGTLIVTDIAYNFDQNNSLGIRLAARILGSYGQLKPS